MPPGSVGGVIMEFDLKTMNMLSMIEMLVQSMGDVVIYTVEHPHLIQPFMRDLIEFNNKLKDYKTKEINNEPKN